MGKKTSTLQDFFFYSQWLGLSVYIVPTIFFSPYKAARATNLSNNLRVNKIVYNNVFR